MKLFIIRAAFAIIIPIVICLILRKTRLRSRWIVIIFCASLMLTIGLALTPIEKAVLTFPSPEESYRYNNVGDVLAVVTGNESALIIGNQGDTDTLVIVPKLGEKWKLSTSIDIRCVYQTVSEGISISIYQYKKTKDFYISVLDTNGGATAISDNLGSQFKAIEKENEALAKVFYTYYAYIDTYDNAYELTVNGRNISIRE